MTVYVDDMLMPASVPNGSRQVRGNWSHLIADTPEELHDFAARLGLRRSWFQEPKGLGGRAVPADSLKAQQWHYDVTAGKRREALRLGAVPVSRREMTLIIRQRHRTLFPEAAAEIDRRWARLADEQPATPS